MLAAVLVEIRAVPAERSRGRHNPRAVKRKMSNFPTRSRATSVGTGRFRYEKHIRVMAPTLPDPPAPAAVSPDLVAPPPSCRRQAKRSASTPDHHRHVEAWRASGLSRAQYRHAHGLDETTFHHWVARLRNRFHRKGRAVHPAP